MNFEKPKKSEFGENEKNCWRYYHFTHEYHKKKHLPPNNPKTSCYETQFLRYRVRQSFWAILCPLPFTSSPSPNNPENQNFEKMEKASGDVINLNLPNKKHDQMMYAYSDMECNSEIQFLR